MTAVQNKPAIVNGNLEWVYEYENYLLQVAKVEKGYWGAIKRNLDIEWSNGVLADYENARGAVICKFHEMKQILKPGVGAIAPELLAFHPANKEVYDDTPERNQELVDQISASGKIYRISVSTDGKTISGNRRLFAALKLNKEAKEAGSNIPFPTVDIEVKHYESDAEELDDLVRQNQHRKKTMAEILKEFKILKEIEEKKARERIKGGKKVEGSGKKTQDIVADRVNEALGTDISGQTLNRGLSALEWAQNVLTKGTKSDVELSENIQELINGNKLTAANKIHKMYADEPEIAQQVAKRKLGDDANRSIEGIAKEVKREQAQKDAKAKLQRVKQRMSKKGGEDADSQAAELQALVEAAIAVGAKPTDDYLTNDMHKMLLIEFLAPDTKQVDCDPFANLLKNSINAKVSYNVIDNGLDKDWIGTVATNIPFSIASHAIKALDRNIREGNTSMGGVIAQSGVLHNKSTQPILAYHKVSVCLHEGRVDFEPGEFLLSQYPDKKTTSFDTDTVTIYYGDRHDEFREAFQSEGVIIRMGASQSYAPPSKLPLWVNTSEDKGSLLVETSWMGNQLKIVEDEQGLLIPFLNSTDTKEAFEDLDKCKAFLVGMVLLSQHNDAIDNSVFS